MVTTQTPKKLLYRLISLKKHILRPHEIVDQIDKTTDKSGNSAGYSCNLPKSLLGGLLKRFVQEVLLCVLVYHLLQPSPQAVVIDPVVAFSLRPAPGRYSYVRMSADDITWEEMSVAEYLKFKERLANGAS